MPSLRERMENGGTNSQSGKSLKTRIAEEQLKNSRLMEVDNLKVRQHEEARKAEEQAKQQAQMKSIGMDVSSQYGPSSPLAKKGNALAIEGAAKRAEKEALPDYGERIRSHASKWPALLQPIGYAIESVAQAPLMVAARQQLGTASDENMKYEFGKGANLAGGALNTIGNITFSGSGGGGIYNATGNVLSRVSPNLANSALGRIAGTGIQGVTEGVTTGVGQELAANPEASPRELLTAGGIGGATGLLPGLGKAIGEGIRGLRGLRGSSGNGVSDPVQARPSVASQESRTSIDPANPINGTEQISDATQQATSADKMKQSWFTTLFGNQGVGISSSGSSKRIGDKPLTTKDSIVKNTIKNDKDGILSEVAAGARATYQNFVDALSPLKRISQETYDTAIDASRANNLANNIIGKDFVTPEGVRIGDGMETIFGKVGRGQDKEFIDYLVLRDAETRVARGERVYDESLDMTPDKIAERVKMYDKRYPGFAAIAKDWDSFTKNLRNTYGLNEGLLNEAQIKAMEESRPFYTPMRRQFKRSEKPGRKWLQNSSGASFSGQKAPIKKVSPTGSVRGIVDPRKTMIEAVGSWANAAMRNRAMQQVFKAINENPEAMKGIAEIVPETAEATKKSLDEINALIKSDGVEGLLERLSGEFDIAFKKGAQKGGEDNIVRAMINGNPVKIRVHDPEIVKALTAMSPQQSGLIIDLLSMFSNATKRGATGALAPLFAARSVTTDLVQSLIQAKNPAMHSVDLVHALFSSIGDKFNIPGLRNLAKEFRLAGGEYSAALRGERELNKRLGNLRRDPLLSPRNIGRQTWKLATSPFKLGEAVSDVSENLNRMAAYRSEMRRLGGIRTPENVRKAIGEAREITTNFSRKGLRSKELEALIPYQNAAVQGTYRIMKSFKAHPIKTTAAVFTLAVAPKMYEYYQFHDDPDYQKIPARERMRNLIISKNDDGTFVKIPMEPAYNSFGEMTISTLRHLKDNDPQAFKGISDALANAWTPPVITGLAQGLTQGTGIKGSVGGTLNAMSPAPIFGTTYNQSFTGAPIVPQRLQDRSDKNQYDERTSQPAKWLGEKLGLAPMKVDYLLRAYGGDPARLLLPLTSDMGAGTTRNTLLKNFIVDPVFTNTLSDDFFSAQERFTNAKADQEVGDPLPSWYTEELDKLVSSRAKGSPYRKITDLNATKREITGNRNLSAEEKARQLRDIQSQINEIYLEVNTKLSAAGVPMPNR